MKKITLFLLLISSHIFAQKNEDGKNAFTLLNEVSQTHILYDAVASVSEATDIKYSNIEPLYYQQILHELQRADFNNRLKTNDEIVAEIEKGKSKNFIPISLLISEFETVKKSIRDNNLITLNSNGKYVLDNSVINPFDKHFVALTAPLINKYKGKNVTFFN
jgi:hypothetical protein